jgi:hypothetical protein
MRIDTRLFENVTSVSGGVLTIQSLNESYETVLSCELSDETLEAAASPTRDGAAAVSFPNAPT